MISSSISIRIGEMQLVTGASKNVRKGHRGTCVETERLPRGRKIDGEWTAGRRRIRELENQRQLSTAIIEREVGDSYSQKFGDSDYYSKFGESRR